MANDMHDKCGIGYEGMWMKLINHEITQDEFDAWFDENCAKCSYMNEVCMYGE